MWIYIIPYYTQFGYWQILEIVFRAGTEAQGNSLIKG